MSERMSVWEAKIVPHFKNLVDLWLKIVEIWNAFTVCLNIAAPTEY